MENNKGLKGKDNSATMWIILGVFIVIVIVAITMTSKNKAENVETEQSAETTGAPVSTEDVTPPEASSGQTTMPIVSSLSYDEALLKYEGRRIQFGENCQANPNTVTYKDNTGIMLDNRSSQARTIKVGTNYRIKAYGFRIVTLPDVYLKAKTVFVDCGDYKNVGTILVQE
jgi:flagellar basal body-associated protein FliL